VRTMSTTDCEPRALRLLRKWFCWRMICWNYCRTYCVHFDWVARKLQMGKMVTSVVLVILTRKHGMCSLLASLICYEFCRHNIIASVFSVGLTVSRKSFEHK
jgi:hypothetical protein